MSKFNSLEIPKSREGMVCKQVDVKALKESGVAMSNYAPQMGDVVEFPANQDECRFVEVPIRKNATQKQYLMAVTKNGNHAWMSLGSIRRRNAKNEIVDDFSKSFYESGEDDESRIPFLFGKTIRMVSTKEDEVRVFENNQPTDKTRKSNFPIYQVQ